MITTSFSRSSIYRMLFDRPSSAARHTLTCRNSYILFEIPANMACKAIGPGWFIPAISLGFGICSLGTAFVHSLSTACGVRFLLGVFEAGMLPGIAYYLSRWYRRSELAFRLSLYIVAAPLAGVSLLFYIIHIIVMSLC